MSPYAMIGLGATYVNIKGGDRKSVLTANLPIGLGVKYKVSERMNVGLEWALHFSLSDELDGQKILTALRVVDSLRIQTAIQPYN